MPFAFLADLQRRVRHLDQDVFSKLIFFAWRVQQFTSAYSSNLIFDVPAYGLNEYSPQIGSLMHEYSTSPPTTDALSQTQNELNQVRDIMVHNVEQILSRGERIELLVDKTDTLSGQAWAFRRGWASAVCLSSWWRALRFRADSSLLSPQGA
jgi:vesicle-associated membrane protein 7